MYNELKKKSNAILLILGVISIVVSSIFIFWRTAPVVLGCLAIIICSVTVGFALGTGYMEQMVKKSEKVKAR